MCLLNLPYAILYQVDSSPPQQNGRHFTDGLFKWIFMNEKFCILIQISLKCPPNASIDNKSALVEVMARCQIGDKPLPEPTWTQFLMHICGTIGRFGKGDMPPCKLLKCLLSNLVENSGKTTSSVKSIKSIYNITCLYNEQDLHILVMFWHMF